MCCAPMMPFQRCRWPKQSGQIWSASMWTCPPATGSASVKCWGRTNPCEHCPSQFSRGKMIPQQSCAATACARTMSKSARTYGAASNPWLRSCFLMQIPYALVSSLNRLQPQLTILCIDDDPAILKLYELRLSVGGARVLTSANGHHGFSAAIESNPDVILLD